MPKQVRKLLIVTNLYPTPWAPNRASFNRQQFERLEEHIDVQKLILIPFTEWWSHRKQCKNTEQISYVPYFYTPKIGRRFYPCFQFLSLLFNLRRIKKFEPDAILASWGYPDAVAVSKLNRLLKKKLFIKIHGSDINENTKFTARTKQIVKHFNRAEATFSVSNALKQALVAAGVDGSRLVTNYNGVDKNTFFPSKAAKKKQIVFVGNLIKEKGIEELLDAFSNIESDYTLFVIGQGPLADKLERQYAGESVFFLGSLPLQQVAEHIRESSLLVLPSYREGVPNVVLESLSSGTPVVATDVGGIPEVLNKDSGIIISDLSDLKTAIEQALEKDWNNSSIVDQAGRFDWDKNVNCVIDTINSKL